MARHCDQTLGGIGFRMIGVEILVLDAFCHQTLDPFGANQAGIHSCPLVAACQETAEAQTPFEVPLG